MPEGTVLARPLGSGVGEPENIDALGLRKIVNSRGFRVLQEIVLPSSVDYMSISVPDDITMFRLSGVVLFPGVTLSNYANLFGLVSFDGTNFITTDGYIRNSIAQSDTLVSGVTMKTNYLWLSPGHCYAAIPLSFSYLFHVGKSDLRSVFQGRSASVYYGNNTMQHYQADMSGSVTSLGRIKKLLLGAIGTATQIGAGSVVVMEGI